MRRLVRRVLWDRLRIAPLVWARPGDVLCLADGRRVMLTAVGPTTWAVEVDPVTGHPRPDRTEGVLSVRPGRGARRAV